MLLDILFPGTLFFKSEMFSETILWLNLYLDFNIVAPVLMHFFANEYHDSVSIYCGYKQQSLCALLMCVNI